MLLRIAGHDRPRVLEHVALEHRHQRSTPPITGSIDAFAATESATRYPSIIAGSAWRFTNDGSRIFTR